MQSKKMARRTRKVTSGSRRAAASGAGGWRARAPNSLREVVRIVNRGWATPEGYLAFEDDLIKAAVAAVQNRTFAEALGGPLTVTVWNEIIAKFECMWQFYCPRCFGRFTADRSRHKLLCTFCGSRLLKKERPDHTTI